MASPAPCAARGCRAGFMVEPTVQWPFAREIKLPLLAESGSFPVSPKAAGRIFVQFIKRQLYGNMLNGRNRPSADAGRTFRNRPFDAAPMAFAQG